MVNPVLLPERRAVFVILDHLLEDRGGLNILSVIGIQSNKKESRTFWFCSLIRFLSKGTIQFFTWMSFKHIHSENKGVILSRRTTRFLITLPNSSISCNISMPDKC